MNYFRQKLHLRYLTGVKHWLHLCLSQVWGWYVNLILTIRLHKKWSFPLRISSVNVTKSARKLWIFSNLLKKSLMENFIFCAVSDWLKRKIYCALIYFPILQRKIISCHNSISVNFKKLKHEKHFQKQPPRDVLKKRCSENIQQIYRRTPMPKCEFNKVAK